MAMEHSQVGADATARGRRQFMPVLDALPADTMRLHASMLGDRDRTAGYVEAVKRVVQPGDVVIDIGTGTGVRPLPAAQAGPAHVYAIEAGRIPRWARRLFEVNGFADVIEPVRGWSDEIVLPERADVLVSELIGDEPLAEDVVEITRDAALRLLKPGARLVPDTVSLYATAVEIPQQALDRMTFTRAQV